MHSLSSLLWVPVVLYVFQVSGEKLRICMFEFKKKQVFFYTFDVSQEVLQLKSFNNGPSQ
jgi:hypothetical protein